MQKTFTTGEPLSPQALFVWRTWVPRNAVRCFWRGAWLQWAHGKKKKRRREETARRCRNGGKRKSNASIFHFFFCSIKKKAKSAWPHHDSTPKKSGSKIYIYIYIRYIYIQCIYNVAVLGMCRSLNNLCVCVCVYVYLCVWVPFFDSFRANWFLWWVYVLIYTMYIYIFNI